MRGVLRGLAIIVYLVFGVVQIAAIITGVTHTMGFFGVVLGIILGPLPVVGTIMGIIGATSVWGWSMGGALLMFVGPLVFSAVAGLLSRE